MGTRVSCKEDGLIYADLPDGHAREANFAAELSQAFVGIGRGDELQSGADGLSDARAGHFLSFF